MTLHHGALSTLISLSLASAAAFAQVSPLSPPANGPRRSDPTWIALANCTIHTSPAAAPLEHATIIFRAGTITAILPGEPATGPDGKPTLAPARTPIGPRLIDCSNLHIYPGFIEPYIEVDAPAPSGDESSKHWNPKVTPQRSALDGPRLDESGANSLRKLGFTAAAISPKSGIFRGSSALISLAKPSDEPSLPKPPTYKNHLYHSIAMDTSGGGYPDSQMGAIAQIRQTLSDAAWQAAQRTANRFNGAINVLDYLAPASSLPNLPLRPQAFLFAADSELETFRIAAITREFPYTAATPYFVLGSGTEYRRPAALTAPGSILILPLNFTKAPDVSSLAKQEGTDLRDMMAWEQAPTNPRRLDALGIKFLLSTARLQNKNDFWSNLKSAIKHGLPEAVALEALTTRPAQALNVADTMGTLEAGKLANITIFDGPAFGKNTENKDSKIRGIWIDGSWHELTPIPTSFEGSWQVSLAGNPDTLTRTLDIDRDNGITVTRDSKTTKASKVEALPGRVSFVFDHDALSGEEGQCSMMALVSSSATHTSPATMTGIGITGSGRRIEWTATRAPKSLAGLWPLTSDQADIQLPTLVFSKTNELTLHNLPGAINAPDAKALAATEFTYDGTTFSCKFESATLTATIDWSKSPATLLGTITQGATTIKWFRKSPTALNGTLTTDTTTTAISSIRREAGNPFTGTWRIVAFGDAPIEQRPADAPRDDKNSFTLKITADSLTLTKKAEGKEPIVIKAKDTKFAAAEAPRHELTFSHELAPLGEEGISNDTVQITLGTEAANDMLIGESAVSTGSKHYYLAVRDQPKSDDDAAPTDIPEKILTPFAAFGLESYPEPEANLIISNATLWTNSKAGIIKKGFIHIRAGKIVAIGEGDPNIATAKDEKCTYIDAKGRHITPGIIDCHSHTGISGGVNESGQAVTAECRIGDVTNPDPVNWYQQLAGGVTAVNNLHGSANAIGGQSQTNKIRWGCASPDDMHFESAAPGIKFALGENPRRANGPDGNSRYPTTRMGVEMLIRDRFTAAAEYSKTRGTPEFRADFELEPLAEILDGKRLVHCHSYRQDEMLMLALVARDFGFRIGTYQHALEGYKVADYVRDYSGGASGFADWWAYKMEVQDAIPEAFPIMAEQGATVSYNSDSNEMARRLNAEAAKAVKYGDVSEEEALKYVTLNPAKQLGIDSRVGSLEEGKDADIALWSGSPLSTFTRCEATWVDGRCLFSIEQDKAMRERIKSERMRLIQKLLNNGSKKKDADSSDAADAPKDTPAEGARPDGRRRRGPRPPQEISEELRQYYIDVANFRHFNEQGICGCGSIH
jgi:imidazolonepropionase-like amidohydrolase